MLNPSDLSNEQTAALLREHYGIDAGEITVMPVGLDYAASVCRVTAADGTSYFLKCKRSAVDPAAVQVPHALRAQGIEQVVAPLPTLSGALTVLSDGQTLIVYPFIDGLNGFERRMTEPQWVEFGAVLRRIHAAALTPDVAGLVEREQFGGRGAWARVRELLALAERDHADPTAAEMAAFWRERRGDLTRCLDRAEQLGQQMQARPVDFVLCHADIHVGNVLVADDGRILIVDWDQPLLAPKERDLMFIVESAGAVAVSPDDQVHFLRGYGTADIDPLAFAYYRTDWVLQDVSSFGAMGFGLNGGDEATRRDAIRWMRIVLGPGGALDAADKANF